MRLATLNRANTRTHILTFPGWHRFGHESLCGRSADQFLWQWRVPDLTPQDQLPDLCRLCARIAYST